MIFIGVPTAGAVHYKLVPWLLRMAKEDVQFYLTGMVGTEVSQNVIVEKFLETDCTHLLLIETDQVPLSSPLELLRHDKDVVSMPTLVNTDEKEIMWGVYDKHEGDIASKTRTGRGKGLEKVWAVTMGCVLIKREVLEKIKNPFTPPRDEKDRRLATSDLVFCKKVNDAGFEVWADWERVTKHYKEIDLMKI